jgi:hypothetical protein
MRKTPAAARSRCCSPTVVRGWVAYALDAGPVPAVLGARRDQPSVAANSKRVPTLFWMNASGKRAASA